MEFATAAWCFPVVIALHNLEEAIWLPAWSRAAGRWHAPVGAFEFRFAIAVLTTLALAATLAAVGPAPTGWGTQALCGYAAAMLANVFVPHVAGTVALRRYVPGTASAVCLNLPVTLLLLANALREGAITPVGLAWAAVVVMVGLLLGIALLFRLGKRLRQITA